MFSASPSSEAGTDASDPPRRLAGFDRPRLRLVVDDHVPPRESTPLAVPPPPRPRHQQRIEHAFESGKTQRAVRRPLRQGRGNTDDARHIYAGPSAPAERTVNPSREQSVNPTKRASCRYRSCMGGPRIALAAGSVLLVTSCLLGAVVPAVMRPQPPWTDVVTQQRSWARTEDWLFGIAAALLVTAWLLLAYSFVELRGEARRRRISEPSSSLRRVGN